MSTNLVINGVSYPFPDPNDEDWGQQVVDWATAVTNALTVNVPVAFVGTANKTVTNTVAETSAVPTGLGTLTLPVNFLTAGKVIRLSMAGKINIKAAAPGTIQFKVKLGSTVLQASSIIDAGDFLANMDGATWRIRVDIVCRTVGASGTVMPVAFAEMLIDDGGGNKSVYGPMQFDVVSAVTIDTTAAHLLDVTFLWGTADPDNILTTVMAVAEAVSV